MDRQAPANPVIIPRLRRACPDAYSYAFDDQTSTFIIPAGAGFQVIFCPGARSTNILAAEPQQLHQPAQGGQAPSGGEYIHLNMTTSAAIRTSGFSCFTFGIALAIAGCSFLISLVF